ncbi:MAG: ATP-binding protein [Pseudomonadales bacterium]|jgi:sigma-B regulation protein RsbU (phosphoserine phosphatase)|nr:ATP-binding protein [Pseudomonadales bacterium]
MTKTKKLLDFQFPARADQLCQVRQRLREAMGACSKSEQLVNCVLLAVGEACMNIIQHAYGKDEQGDIILEVEKHGSNVVVFRLTDFAHHKTRAQDMQSRPLDEIRPGGLGCHIINEVMDEVQLIECDSDCGNVLQMKKRLRKARH